MDNTLYDYSPIVNRPPLRWPNGARVAFYVGLNIEHYEIDKPATSIFAGTAHYKPDPLNFGWRDYGLRVGFWRIIEALDHHGIRASALLNSDVCSRYPQIIQAGRQRGWAWVAHGRNNSTFQADVAAADEPGYLADVIQTISTATGQHIQGWMGPGLSESFNTARLLKELGLSYVLDWCADDQPFELSVPSLLAVPYSVELNDVTLFLGQGLSGEAFVRRVLDQLEQLLRDSENNQSGRVMALALHPFIMGQAFRYPYLDRLLQQIAAYEGVWLTTSDEIAAHFSRVRSPLSA